MRRFGAVVAVALVALVTAACVPPLSTKGDTGGIQLVSTKNLDGWKYDYYRNMAYPCSVSGYQTFVIGTKIGSSPTAARPLWTFMHGGGAGYFDENGNPIPNENQKVEEGAGSPEHAASTTTGCSPGCATTRPVSARSRSRTAATRSTPGAEHPRPAQPEHDARRQAPPDRPAASRPRPRSSTRQSLYPTTKTFLHGGSAGSAGAYYVAWAMQLQGIAPAGVVADASVVNRRRRCRPGTRPASAPTRTTRSGRPAIAARVHPDIANVGNEVDKLVSSGRLTVPLLHIWNHGDQNTCGSPPVACPLRDGTTVTLGIHRLRPRAAASRRSPRRVRSSRSKNLPLCVDDDAVPDCSVHVVTNKGGLVEHRPVVAARLPTPRS